MDVLASYSGSLGSARGSVTTLMRDVLVLSAPSSSGGAGGGNTSNIVLRVSEADATNLAFAADNGKVWVALRPPLGASQATPSPTSSRPAGG